MNNRKFKKVVLRCFCHAMLCIPLLTVVKSVEAGNDKGFIRIGPPTVAIKSEKNNEVLPKQKDPEIIKSVKIGIHLASYKETKNIQSGWNILEHDFAEQLKGRVALYYQAKVKDTQYTRLVVGNFNSQSAALQVCKTLESKGQYCQVTNYTIASKKT